MTAEARANTIDTRDRVLTRLINSPFKIVKKAWTVYPAGVGNERLVTASSGGQL